jgi:phenylpyruvate tautomerase PptA (4-oxalocrotonate tautomerase family)
MKRFKKRARHSIKPQQDSAIRSCRCDTKLRIRHAMTAAQIIWERTSADAAFILNQPDASTTVVIYFPQRKSWQVGNHRTRQGEPQDITLRMVPT